MKYGFNTKSVVFFADRYECGAWPASHVPLPLPASDAEEDPSSTAWSNHRQRGHHTGERVSTTYTQGRGGIILTNPMLVGTVGLRMVDY